VGDGLLKMAMHTAVEVYFLAECDFRAARRSTGQHNIDAKANGKSTTFTDR